MRTDCEFPVKRFPKLSFLLVPLNQNPAAFKWWSGLV
jgi:hypothetical protein